ncbi:MAG: pimeloyl-ACP methyl ester carboxylesterase [Cryomorphaceae bacterium]|jgi:pimeloyl-ACP methyl ester carboxylesterase
MKNPHPPERLVNMHLNHKLLLATAALIYGGILSSCKSGPTDKETVPQETATELEVVVPDEITFSQEDAQQAIQENFKNQAAAMKEATAAEMKAKVITYKKFKMPYDYLTYGEEPEGGHSLYISLHGGGGAPAHVNDGQWRNQIKLYKPKEGIYLAPRAATNTWNLWHQAHIDPMFDTLIDRFIAHHGVNPDRVYVLGYSAGGDGIYQLAPRMADRWAGAAMMAGHPGDAKPHNLLNLPYFIQCGGKDAAYKRNELCATWGKMLDKLAEENPGHYPHKWIVYPEHGHWMKLDCKQAIPWMAKNTRDPWAKQLNWYQDNVLHTRFAWLANDDPKKEDFVTAEVNGQTITLTTENVKKLTLRLNDKLVNLDKEIIVKDGSGKELFKGKIERSAKTITKSLSERLDISSVATAELEVSF